MSSSTSLHKSEENEIHHIHINKQSFKFSIAHMTVFPDGFKEPLHGHNYYTQLSMQLKAIDFDHMLNFAVFKVVLKRLCTEWDEKVLIATENKFFHMINQNATDVEFTVCNKRYVLPADETILLPIDNISSERLAQVFCQKFRTQLDAHTLAGVLKIQVAIEESPGQGATCTWTADAAAKN